MSRKGQARIREVTPDPKFHDHTIAKFVNVVMERGKKSLAEGILYGALDLVADRAKEDGLAVFKKALDNVRPSVEVRSRRWAAPTTRCQARCGRCGATRSRCAGW